MAPEAWSSMIFARDRRKQRRSGDQGVAEIYNIVGRGKTMLLRKGFPAKPAGQFRNYLKAAIDTVLPRMTSTEG